MKRRVLYLVTEDWYFLSHRLPMARAAQAAGYEVHVATRLEDGAAAIAREGFKAHALGWRRGSASLAGNVTAAREVRTLLGRVEPDVLHNIALKPVLVGSLAARSAPGLTVVNSFAGLGSVYLARSLKGRVMRAGVTLALRRLLARPNARAVVQNPDDGAALEELGLAPERIVLIPGSGVDTHALIPLPEPDGPITVAYVGRMLEDKGLRALRAAHSGLRAKGLGIDLLLAGDCDPENPGSLTEQEMRAWSAEPGVTWLGHVEDIKDVWRQAHIAVLPSRREGLPKSLLEAAACGRAMVATDVPGCREIAREGKTALLAPVDDAVALAGAIERLAGDAELRKHFGGAARTLAERVFSADEIGRRTVALYEALLAGRD